MGSALQINVVDKSGFDSEESDFVVSVINNFADGKKVPLTQAYSYIVTFKGMGFYSNTRTLRRPPAIKRLSMMSHVYAQKDSGIREKYNCMLVGVEEGQENLTAINHNRRFSKGNIIWVVGEKDSVMKLVKDAG